MTTDTLDAGELELANIKNWKINRAPRGGVPPAGRFMSLQKSQSPPFLCELLHRILQNEGSRRRDAFVHSAQANSVGARKQNQVEFHRNKSASTIYASTTHIPSLGAKRGEARDRRAVPLLDFFTHLYEGVGRPSVVGVVLCHKLGLKM